MWTNSCGPRIERSTWVSAAKLTMASHPAAARATASGRRCPSDEFVLDAVEIGRVARIGELVEHDDGRPPSARRRTKCEPMNPAPPVTSTRIGKGTAVGHRYPPTDRSLYPANHVRAAYASDEWLVPAPPAAVSAAFLPARFPGEGAAPLEGEGDAAPPLPS